MPQKGICRHPCTKDSGDNRITRKPSTRENIVIELTAASDFNKFIYVVFQTLRQNPDKPARRSDKAFSPPSDTFAVPDGDTVAPYQADKSAYG